MLDLAESLTPFLSARRDRIRNGTAILRNGLDEEEAGQTTLQLLFLDGEEAFKDWTNTDSIYGARYVPFPSPPYLSSAKRIDI
jgi:glutaminyl-peptide cyclotransferase